MSTHTRSLQRWTAILSAVLVVLLTAMLYLVWQDNQLVSSSSPSHADASSIRIHRDGFADVRLSRNGASWNIDTPCEVAANQQRLEPLLGALTPGAHQYDASDVDLEAAGLISPLAIVSIDEMEHRIGNTDLGGDRRYVQRDNRVEFVPEWVLSLINGGVTALAELAIFDQSLQRLTLVDEHGSQQSLTSTEDLLPWQNLSAQQIVPWPLDGMTVPQPTLRLQATTANGSSTSYIIYDTDRFTAVTLEGKRCAYIMPPDTLPN